MVENGTMGNREREIYARALKDHLQEHSQEAKQILDRSAKTVEEALTATEAIADSTKRTVMKYESRLGELEAQPRRMELIQPVYKTEMDMGAVAEAVKDIGIHVSYAIASIPKHEAPDMGPIAKAVSEMADAIIEQGKRIEKQNEMIAKVLKAMADKKPDSHEHKVAVAGPDLSGIEKVIAKVLDVMRQEKPEPKQKKRKIRVKRVNDEESVITEE